MEKTSSLNCLAMTYNILIRTCSALYFDNANLRDLFSSDLCDEVNLKILTIEIKVRKLLPIVESQRLYLLRAFPTRFSINKGFHFSPTALAKSVKWVLFKIHNSIYFPAILPQAMTEITVRTLNRFEIPGNIIVFASERLCMALWHKSRQPNVEEKNKRRCKLHSRGVFLLWPISTCYHPE